MTVLDYFLIESNLRAKSFSPPNFMNRFSRKDVSQSGVALILVLGIVALLTVMVVAFLGVSSRQVNDSKGANAAVEKGQFAEFAASQFLSDLKNEILAGSVSPVPASAEAAAAASAGSLTLYPATPLSAAPDRFSTSPALGNSGGSFPSRPVVGPPNLIKQSASKRDFYDKNLGIESISGFEAQPAFPKAVAYPPSSRASDVSSNSGTPDSVSAARWNRPLLLPRKDPSKGDEFPLGYEPKDAGSVDFRVAGEKKTASWTWQAPHWVYVTQDGSNPNPDTLTNTQVANPVIGRYAYQAYDVGGLLDLNVAGHSNDVTPRDAAKKGSTGLADLTVLGLTADQIKGLLKFRNPASLDSQTAGGPFKNNYLNFLLRTPDPKSTSTWPSNNGFLRVGGTDTVTNNAFSSRRALKSFLLSGMGAGTVPASDSAETAKLMEALQYFTHFSRSLEQPSFKPGFFLNDSAGNRTRSNATPAASTGAGGPSTADSPVFIRPSIVPPKNKIDDILYPISVVPTAIAAPAVYTSYKQPYETALGNNRGGNDAWGTLDERSYGTNPLSLVTSSVKPSQKNKATPLQDVINPSFLEVKVRNPFRRMDNTQATAGEPLVKKRFPLERLSWLTYKGPSAALSPGEPSYNSLGTEDNIKKAFGLTWMPTASSDPEQGHFWAYDHGKTGEIYTLDEITELSGDKAREPDFIELLYAAVAVGSVGKSALADHAQGQPWDTSTYQQVRDRTSRFQILEIAANIIDQNDSDSYSTIIKLPNPILNKDFPGTPYYPALFTARGVEDLPYFYRMHSRAIKNFNQYTRVKPDIDPVGIQGVTRITGSMSSPAWNNSNYDCGTTSLILFPELWNPHAQNLSGSGSDAVPTEFRVLAASQTPSDILSTTNNLAFSGLLAASDRGLMNNPKLFDKSSGSPANHSEWMWIQPEASKYFSSRAIGNFYFSFRNEDNLWNQNLWGWLLGSTQPRTPGDVIRAMTGEPIFDLDGSLFWNDPSNKPFLDTNTYYSGMATDALIAGCSAFEYPLWRLPNSMTGSLTPDLDFRKVVTTGSGATAGTYGFLSAGSLAQFWPYTEGPGLADNLNSRYDGLDSARWYILDYPAGTSWPLSQRKHFSDTNTVRVALSNSTVGSRTTDKRHFIGLPNYPANTPASVDFRGSELLFSNNAKTPMFREPTPLCFADMPSGSNLRASENSFFSGYPYNGSIVDKSGTKWIGFSLGESPSQFISAVRLEAGSGDLVIDSGSYDLAGRPLKSRRKGDYTQLLQSGGTVSFTSATGVTSGTSNVFEFFAVPVNMVGITDDHLFTVQMQFKGADGNWVTYDERYLKMRGGDGSRTPVVGKSQLTPNGAVPDPSWGYPPAGYAVNGTQLGPQMGWGSPLITSYDPRSSRFGHPSRLAEAGQECIYGSQAQRFALSPISNTDHGLLGLGDHNFTDRTSTSLLDSFTANNPASVLTVNTDVPASWNMVGGFTLSAPNVDKSIKPPLVTMPLPFSKLFDVLQGKTNDENLILNPPSGFFAPNKARGSSPYWAQWWALGKYNSLNLWQSPSINSYDYGWFSRTLFPKSNTNPFLNYFTATSFFNYGTFSADPSIPNFKNFWYWHTEFTPNDPPGFHDYADALRIGAFTENIQPNYADPTDPLYTAGTESELRQAYADPDDIVRRAMGAFAAYGGYSSTSRDGLPQGQLGAGANKDNRPVVLNRPFQSVAELGYAFRGSPWKNLSFSTPETGDAALLDVFCLTEAPPTMKGNPITEGVFEKTTPPLVAGKVNLNTRQEPVLTAMLNGALKDESSAEITGIAAEASPMAQTLIGRTTANKAWLGPLSNVSELAGKLFGKDIPTDTFNMRTDPVYTSIVYQTASEPTRNPDMAPGQTRGKLTWHYTGVSADMESVFLTTKDRKNLRMRESVIRALADGGQTRVWNIMLDLVVQTGKLKPKATTLAQFNKDAERRVWVFFAIDRLTGEILDYQVEDITD